MKYIFKHEKMVLLKKKRFISRKNAFLDPYEGQTAAGDKDLANFAKN